MSDARTSPELLLPAGSLNVLKVAVRYGADAVYIGGEEFGLRSGAKNFSPEDMKEGIRWAHEHGARVYVTANILAHNRDLGPVREYFTELKNMKPDALIISDPGVFAIAREILPEMEIHISTQANNTNYGTFRFWHDQGASRAVCARELSLAEIREIRNNIPDDMEIEAFVHGSMCISYSGRCLLSSYLTGRDANRGECTHPCRWKYAVVEETRPGQYMPVVENERGTYIFNSKDLCMIEHLPDLYEAGIDSFKVEGRMKTALYVAVTARAYRLAMNDYESDPDRYTACMEQYRRETASCTTRPFTTGFYYGRPSEEAQIYDSSTYTQGCVYLGTAGPVNPQGCFSLEQKNKFCVGDEIEIMKPDGRNLPAKVLRITDEDGNDQESAPRPKQKLSVWADTLPEEGDVLRKSGLGT